MVWGVSSLLRYQSSYFFLSCVEAARKVCPDWSQKTMTRHSFNCFSIVWGQGLAPSVTSLLSSRYMTGLQMCFIFKLCVLVTAPEITSKLKLVLASSVFVCSLFCLSTSLSWIRQPNSLFRTVMPSNDLKF